MARACYLCGTARDLRPYGPRGEDVCFDCAMSTPERKADARRAFGAQLDAAEAVGTGAVQIGTDAGPFPTTPPTEQEE